MIFVLFALSSCTESGEDSQQDDFGDIKVSDTRQLTQTVAADQTQGSSEVIFTTLADWKSTIDYGPQSTQTGWLTISPERGDAAATYTIRLTLSVNEFNTARTAIVNITCGKTQIPISITQQGNENGEDPWQPGVPNQNYLLHKIIGYDGNGVKEVEMEYSYDLTGVTDLTIRETPITALKISWADDDGVLRPTDSYSFTHEEGQIGYRYTSDPGKNYTELTEGFLRGYRMGISGASLTTTTTLPDSDEGDASFTCTYGTGTFNSRHIVSVERQDRGGMTDEYTWNTRTTGPAGAWYNCVSLIWNNLSGTKDSQVYSFDPDQHWQYLLPERFYVIGDPMLLLVTEPDALRALGFFGANNNNLFTKVVTTFGDTSVTQSYEYTAQQVTAGAKLLEPLVIKCRKNDGYGESVCQYRLQFQLIEQ